MRTRTTAAAISGAALLLALVGCSSTPEPAAKASSSQPAGLTAKTAAAKLADATGVTTLGDPQDNTNSCSNKAAGKEPHANDCTALVTTDTVSIYEFDKSTVAATWVKGISKASTNADWRQVDRFVLAFGARDQALTSDERRDELEQALGSLVAKQ
ncbi:hypothetical protein ACIOG7_10425 [Streptomyces sp. NPDC087894]|uniref:hypothetical protein n=1 Tax=Streptomyces sp. NPDC087894 TaxID=3365816 RepID=UPI0038298B02